MFGDGRKYEIWRNSHALALDTDVSFLVTQRDVSYDANSKMVMRCTKFDSVNGLHGASRGGLRFSEVLH